MEQPSDPSMMKVISVMLDDITFMLYDLERGGAITNKQIDPPLVLQTGGFVVEYKRTTMQDYYVGDVQTIISNFTVIVHDGQRDCILDYEVYGELRKFKINHMTSIEMTAQFLEALDSHRVSYFLSKKINEIDN